MATKSMLDSIAGGSSYSRMRSVVARTPSGVCMLTVRVGREVLLVLELIFEAACGVGHASKRPGGVSKSFRRRRDGYITLTAS